MHGKEGKMIGSTWKNCESWRIFENLKNNLLQFAENKISH